LGGATASQQTIDTIAVYIPPVLGALAIIPVYFIGRALINRWAGIIAIVLMALMPGEFLSRSLLGNTDHHVAEEFSTSFFIVFFILAIKHGRQFTYAMLRRRQFNPASRHIIYSFVAGIFLGLYLITWQGALLFVFIVFIYFIVQFISDHLRGFPTDYLSKIAITTFLIAMLIVAPVSRDKATFLSLAVIILVPIALNVISAIMSARNIKPVYFLAVVAVPGLIGLLITWLMLPFISQPLIGFLIPLFNWNMQQNVVGEMKPIFFPGGFFTLEVAWTQYALALYSGLAGLVLIIYQAVRKGEPDKIFVVIWSLIIMLASFSMVRYASYFAVCLAVLTGYLGGWIIEAFSQAKEPEIADKARRKSRRHTQTRNIPIPKKAIAAIMAAVLVIIVLVPGTTNAVSTAKNPAHAPGDAWMEALEWLKKNTPEPFGDADFYYKLYSAPEPGKSFNYPPTAYSVLVWGDYGYWVTRIGRRIPTSNTGALVLIKEALYFTSDNPANAGEMLKDSNAKYIIIDNRIASPNDKLYALLSVQTKKNEAGNWITKYKESDFYELCWYQKAGKYEPLLVFYPEFYRSMVIRLYNFDSKQVVPRQTSVMTYENRRTAQGDFKEITGIKNFNSYEDAEAFIASQKSGSHSIIGTDPMASPVPLKTLTDYKLVYSSSQKASNFTAALPEIKIFEYSLPGSPAEKNR
ncbi:MAG: oligosaccharyl transferase, archaeosortase A system-associated, partial [Chloroflexi bacterium]|nr:oligosaccharyl transferase, archaeosortase A system-associated [Chloroflexota bacterium]